MRAHRAHSGYLPRDTQWAGCMRELPPTDRSRHPKYFLELNRREIGISHDNGVGDTDRYREPKQNAQENWYLADIVELSRRKSYLRDNFPQKNYDGTDAKEVLKKPYNKGTVYSETQTRTRPLFHYSHVQSQEGIVHPLPTF